jgi:asparagine synthase (glutamine-hydrolysing)
MKLLNNKGYKWESNECVSVKGFAFNELNKMLSGKDFADYFIDVTNEDNFVKKLKLINGFFSVIIKKENNFYAAVDYVRSFPLFYRDSLNELFIFDSIEKNTTKNFQLDDQATYEYLSSSYTLGNSTLFKQVKQLLAGQYLVYTNNSLSVDFYYRHSHNYSNKKENLDSYFNELDEVSVNIFSRIKEASKNKTIIIPLSGGYDSRYIAAFCKRIGLENIICYTYGKKGSFEVDTSREVAEKLGYDWYFIEYSEEKWKKLLKSKKNKEFNFFASNYSSLPHYQEFIAVQELKEKKILPNDSIFIPGFCGDLLGGSLLPQQYSFDKEKELLNIRLEDYIFNKFYNNQTIGIDLCKNDVIRSIHKSWIKNNISNSDEFVNYYEEWFLQQRVGKYVNNAVRVYEFFGYEWLLPLWDKELVEYWYTIPNKFRVESRLYNTFLIEKLFKPLNIDFRKQDEMKPSTFRNAIKKMIPIYFLPALKKIGLIIRGKDNLLNINSYDQFSSIMYKDFDSINIKIKKHTHVNRLYALWVLNFNFNINVKKFLK